MKKIHIGAAAVLAASSIAVTQVVLADTPEPPTPALEKSQKETVIELIATLSNESTSAEILYAREQYNLLVSTDTEAIVDIEHLLAVEKEFAAFIDEEIKKLTPETEAEYRETIRELVDSLAREVYGQLKSVETLENVEAEVELLHQAAEKEAVAVISMIDRLNEYSWADTIAAAREAFESLEELAQGYVTNIENLIAVEEHYALQQKMMEAQKEALIVDELIAKLSTSSTQYEVERTIVRFDELSLLAQSYVTRTGKLNLFSTYYDRLKQAQINQLKRQALAVEQLIAKLSYNSTVSQVAVVRAQYVKLDPLAQPFVGNYALLVRYEAYVYEQDRLDNSAQVSAKVFDAKVSSVKRTATKVQLLDAHNHYKSLSTLAKSYVKMYQKLNRIEKLQAGISTSYEYLMAAEYTSDFMTKPVPIYVGEASNYEVHKPFLKETYNGYEGTVQLSAIKKSSETTLTFTANDNVEIALPMTAVQKLRGTELTVAVAVDVNELIFTIEVDGQEIRLSDYIELQIPMLRMGTIANAALFKVGASWEWEPASFVARAPFFLVRTKESTTFISTTAKTAYAGAKNDQHKFYIEQLAKRGIIAGDSGASYYPKQAITRADFSVMLARAANISSPSKTTFVDIENEWYENDVLSLYKAGVIQGVSATHFNPNAPLTRQQAALMITRLLKHLKLDVNHMMNTDLLPFKDVQSLSVEGKNAIALMYMLGIFNGREDGTFNPNGQLTRSQMAKVLYNTMQAADLM